MTVKRVCFIRSGETDWNRQGRLQGWVAIPLNAHGRQQVQALAKYVRHIGLSALYSSDLRRAVETAELLAAELGFEPILDARWRERDIGQWQGLTLEEVRAWYADDYRQLLADVESFVIPDGESRAALKARVQEAFNDVRAQDRGETVGVVTHTTVLRVLLATLIPGLDWRGMELGNTSVTTIARADGGEGWQLVQANDVMHLEGLETRSARELED